MVTILNNKSIRNRISLKLLITFLLVILICFFAIYFIIETVLLDQAIKNRADFIFEKSAHISKWVKDKSLVEKSKEGPLALSVIKNLSNSLESRVYVLREDEKVLFDNFYLIEHIPFNRELIEKSKSLKKNIYEIRLSKDKQNILYTVYPIIKNDNYMASVYSITDISYLNNSIKDKFFLVLSISFFIIFASIIILALLFRYYLKPIDSLEIAIKEFARGDYKYKIKNNDNDFMPIINSFNLIGERLYEVELSQSQFISDMSHEIKTPVASMLLLTQSLISSKDNASKSIVYDFLEDIEKENLRLKTIIDDMLYMATLEKKDISLNLDIRPVNKVIEESIKVLNPIAKKKKITIEYKANKKVFAEIDFNKLRQISINILSNAIKYSPENTKISIELKEDRNRFIIIFKDNGYGIAEDEKKYIFDRLYRIDKARNRVEGGTGLGLFITRQLVNLHRGIIIVESEVDKGSIFTVEIPLKYEVIDEK